MAVGQRVVESLEQRILFNVLPDPSFGFGGSADSAADGYSVSGNAIAVQSDGKIIVGGSRPLGINNVDLARFTSGGALDTTFGAGGFVETKTPASGAQVDQILLTPDAKIDALIGPQSVGNPQKFSIIRYDSNGSADKSFAQGGDLQLSKSFRDLTYVAGVAMQPDGKVIVAGGFVDGATSGIVLMRFTANGALDTSFGDSGQAKINVDAGAEQLAIQTDGSIDVVADGSTLTQYTFYLFKYTSDGRLARTFGDRGNAQINLASYIYTASANLLTSDAHGDVYVGGIEPDGNVLLAKYLATGRLDRSFGARVC